MRFAIPCLLFLCAAGCANGTSGALGQTNASAACPPSDLVCAISGIDAPIAQGATLPLDVSVTSDGTTTPPLSFVTANENIFTIEDARLHAKNHGLA